ncbi:hypothetical protein FT663_04935 [Candidozyma haemuli var. vulneris]|uniref:Inhibitor I9 domain-containing protein n=1 Tax=Candidozyma haemuli TaxID=45357 RepID=A0A2V1AYZ7_9ASCO|nr:hypothetical protein CXQ85_003031 [[Candida] haemuloni]KAF3986320.1 hypothetical protein FT663_04935 [[Candida] haemuloni var. vulneris]KAF3986982.1 hypothetical protein FT662_04261 [[Candida] haemuloni var. vulneris]PVH23297.1 hypothetical protein CXQ85_003031 [[Candida] haemuloni]
MKTGAKRAFLISIRNLCKPRFSPGGKLKPGGDYSNWPVAAPRSKYFVKPQSYKNSSPTTTTTFPGTNMVEGTKNYIVTLKEDSSDDIVNKVKSQVASFGGKVLDDFSLIKGFVARLPPVEIDSLKGHEGVVNVEEDQEVRIQDNK